MTMGAAGCLFPLPGPGIEPTVDHLHPPIVATPVFSRHPAQTALKGRVKAGKFIPGSQIRWELKAPNRLYPIGQSNAAPQQ